MGDFINSEMLRGHIDTIILLSLVDGDRDSNEIRADIEKKSENRYSVKQGTFYSAMKRLTKQNYIKEYRSSASDGIRRKYYSLTEKGKRFLDKNREEWLQSKELIDGLIETPSEPIERGLPKAEKPEDEFEKFKELASDIGDYRVEDGAEEESYLDRLGSDVFADIQSELDALNAPAEEEASPLPEEETEPEDETALETVMQSADEEPVEEPAPEETEEIVAVSDEEEGEEDEISADDAEADETPAGEDETSDKEENDSPYVLLDSMEENSASGDSAGTETEQDDIYEISEENEEEPEEIAEATEEFTEPGAAEDDELSGGETEEEEEIIDRDLIETQQELDKLLGIDPAAEETTVYEESEPAPLPQDKEEEPALQEETEEEILSAEEEETTQIELKENSAEEEKAEEPVTEDEKQNEGEKEEIAAQALSDEKTEEQAKENEDPGFLLSVTTDHDFTAPAYDDSAYRIIEETDGDYIHIRGIIDEQKTVTDEQKTEDPTPAQTEETEIPGKTEGSAAEEIPIAAETEDPETVTEGTESTETATEKEYVEPVDAENAFKGFNIIYNRPQEELFTADDFASVETPDFSNEEEIPEETDSATAEEIPQENYETAEASVSDVEINIISQNAKIEEKPIVIFASSDYDFPSPTDAQREEPRSIQTESEPVPPEPEETQPSTAPQTPVMPQEEENPAEDDYLYAEDGKPAMQREYKSILSKLFPKTEEKETLRENVVYVSPEKEPQAAEPVQPARTVDLDEYFARATQKHYEETYRNYENTYAEQAPAPRPAEEPQPEPVEEEPVSAYGVTDNGQNGYGESVYNAETAPRETRIEKQVTEREALSSDGTADFSDLYAMANREGFKIRTSSATNRFSGRYILANKLNMNTAWLFFFVLFGEMALMNYVFAQEVGWSWTVKGSLVAAAFLVPLILTIRYFVSGNNKVTEIAPFRSAMEVSLIITFQIVIIVLAVALFSSIDFNSYSQVLSYIAIPCIFALNIPVFFILKYLLLESGKYFTK